MLSEAGPFWVKPDGQASSMLMQASSGQLDVKSPGGLQVLTGWADLGLPTAVAHFLG